MGGMGMSPMGINPMGINPMGMSMGMMDGGLGMANGGMGMMNGGPGMGMGSMPMLPSNMQSMGMQQVRILLLFLAIRDASLSWSSGIVSWSPATYDLVPVTWLCKNRAALLLCHLKGFLPVKRIGRIPCAPLLMCVCPLA